MPDCQAVRHTVYCILLAMTVCFNGRGLDYITLLRMKEEVVSEAVD